MTTDIVQRLSAFPIAEWKEARDEILRLRELLTVKGTEPLATYGEPSGTETTREIETKTYPDGTVVTGTPPFPESSPIPPPEPGTPNLQEVMDDLKGQISALSADLAASNDRVLKLEGDLDASTLAIAIEDSPLVLDLKEKLA